MIQLGSLKSISLQFVMVLLESSDQLGGQNTLSFSTQENDNTTFGLSSVDSYETSTHPCTGIEIMLKMSDRSQVLLLRENNRVGVCQYRLRSQVIPCGILG